KFVVLLEILIFLANQKNYRILSGGEYIKSFRGGRNDKMKPVYEYIINDFTQRVCLDEAARLAHMDPSAFSRYFKRIHKKTFIQFVNEVKIGYACKLLLSQKYNVSQVCYRSGFNNISNFNRQFKSLKKMTPTEF